ncbi:MAG TPA: hypothetical protein VMB74_11765 [Streptosporangiaceae bacterium]|nr:hypothetical protein [Streptosporangiaceae bacterium]
MTGSDLIVEIPWILFGLFLAGIGFRLRGFRRLPGRRRNLKTRELTTREPGKDEASSSAEPMPSADSTGNDRQRHTAG